MAGIESHRETEDDVNMVTGAIASSWEQFFTVELERLRSFYSMELSKEDFREAEEWLKDRLEVSPSNKITDRILSMSECDIRQLRYDFIQAMKKNRRFRKSPGHGKPLAVGATNPLGENEERDRGIE